MKYSDKLKSFVGGKGSFVNMGDGTFVFDLTKQGIDKIEEVGDDCIMINHASSTELTGEFFQPAPKRTVVPLNRLIVNY
jgi:hypothetical protein